MRGRRLVPAAALLAGAAVLLAGLFTLERIFAKERAAALSGLAARRNALELYARRALEDALSARLAAAEKRIDAARRDPLVPANELLLVVDGRQLLPRRFTPPPPGATRARELAEALRAGASPPADDSPFAERVALFRRFAAAVASGRKPAVEESFRALATHRMLHVLPAAQDLAISLASLELLSERSTPRPDLMRALLRDGLADGRGARAGLQRALLERREKLSPDDFVFLGESVVALSRAWEVPWEDFRARSLEPSGPAVPVPPDLRSATIVDGRWYVEPRPDGTLRGAVVAPADALADVTAEMKRRGLLGPEARLRADAVPVLVLASAPLHVDAPALDREADAARRAYRVKAAWGVSCGILAALLAALGVLWVRQERRYLDLKAEFVATVSHELKTPLASVRLLAETLERRLPAGDGRDYPARIVREVDRLAFLVENILSFHRISKGKVMPRLADVNVREVVEAVHRDRSGGRDVSLSAEAVPDTWLRADPELLHLVFSNLYENSWRHGVRRPVEIRVSAEPRAGAVEVLFADNGPGLPQPGGVSNGAARHGSGLGLEICRRIVALHGGSMRVVKSGPEGTTFGMSLPAS